MPTRARLADEEGFTLIEMLMTMVYLGVIFSLFAALISLTVSNDNTLTSESALQAQVRGALDQITSEVRQALPLTTTSTSAFVTSGGTMSPTSLTFYTPDETYSSGSPTTFHLNEESFSLSGGNLDYSFAQSTNTGGIGTTWTMPALGSAVAEVSGITNSSIFTYFDDNGAATTVPADVATVVVTLTVKEDSAAGSPITYTDSATLRIAP